MLHADGRFWSAWKLGAKQFQESKGSCGDRSRTRKVIGPEYRARYGRHFHLVLAAWEVGGPGACGRADRRDAGSPDHGRLPCRGASHILTTSLAGKPGATSRLPADADCTGIRPALLLGTSDAQGAVLYPEEGYALIAETAAFMAAAVNEHRHSTRTLRPSCARSPETSPSHSRPWPPPPPGQRAWSHPGDVDPGSPGGARGSLRPSVHDPRGTTRSTLNSRNPAISTTPDSRPPFARPGKAFLGALVTARKIGAKTVAPP
jgi:hypothetical protein